MDNYLFNNASGPRLNGGELRFRYGNTFPLTIELEAPDQDGEPVNILPEDTVYVEIADRTGRILHKTEYSKLSANRLNIAFDDSLSTKLIPGKYTIRISVKHRNSLMPSGFSIHDFASVPLKVD